MMRLQPVQGFAEEQPLQTQETEVKQSPCHKVQAGAMPEAGEGPDDQKIQIHPARSLAVAAERNIDILPEPGGKGDMPPLPEFTDGTRGVGIIEIFLEGEAEHAAETDGHIGVAGKIKVDLERIKQHLQPLQSRGKAAGGQIEEDIRVISEGIGEDHLFRKAVAKTLDTVSPFCQRRLAVIDLGSDIPVFDDGPRNELRKQGDIKQDLAEIFLRIHISPINIDHVTHGLECIERDTERQRDLRCRENFLSRDPVDESDQEIKVLEIPE